jgi:hypothetical protein
VDTPDAPAGPISLLPGFRPPPTRRLDPPLAEETAQEMGQGEGPTTTAAGVANDVGPDHLEPAGPRPRPADTPTPTSSAGKPTAAQTAKLIAGLLGLAVAGAAAVIGWRGRRQLRRPSKQQLDDISAPLARITIRHVPADLLKEDLADAALAGAAVGAYLTDGPLILPADIDPGVPANLTELEETAA